VGHAGRIERLHHAHLPADRSPFDATVTDLALNTPAHVAHWPEGRRETTLGVLLIRMTSETAQHAGHADIIRELTDDRISGDKAPVDTFWRDRRNKIQEAANHFRRPGTIESSISARNHGVS
jgi:hypothetical protein